MERSIEKDLTGMDHVYTTLDYGSLAEDTLLPAWHLVAWSEAELSLMVLRLYLSCVLFGNRSVEIMVGHVSSGCSQQWLVLYYLPA